MTIRRVLAATIKRFSHGGWRQGGPLITHIATEPACLFAATRYATGWTYPHTLPQDPLIKLHKETLKAITRVLRRRGIKHDPIIWNDHHATLKQVLSVLREARDGGR